MIKKRPCDWGFRLLKERLLQRGFGRSVTFSEEKLDYILWTTHMLTKCYHVPKISSIGGSNWPTQKE